MSEKEYNEKLRQLEDRIKNQRERIQWLEDDRSRILRYLRYITENLVELVEKRKEGS